VGWAGMNYAKPVFGQSPKSALLYSRLRKGIFLKILKIQKSLTPSLKTKFKKRQVPGLSLYTPDLFSSFYSIFI
jgi:hypothetical protein